MLFSPLPVSRRIAAGANLIGQTEKKQSAPPLSSPAAPCWTSPNGQGRRAVSFTGIKELLFTDERRKKEEIKQACFGLEGDWTSVHHKAVTKKKHNAVDKLHLVVKTQANAQVYMMHALKPGWMAHRLLHGLWSFSLSSLERLCLLRIQICPRFPAFPNRVPVAPEDALQLKLRKNNNREEDSSSPPDLTLRTGAAVQWGWLLWLLSPRGATGWHHCIMVKMAAQAEPLWQ